MVAVLAALVFIGLVLVDCVLQYWRVSRKTRDLSVNWTDDLGYTMADGGDPVPEKTHDGVGKVHRS